MFLRRSLLAAAVIALSGAAGAGMTQQAPVVRAAAPRPRREMKRYHATPSSWRHTYLNHGPTAAQVKRAAKKARTVRRHKQHVRGAK